MPKNSPPKHRHDGTSPLPLSMDWSPPPKRWEGRNTVWPHSPQTGWSYCVMIPSWLAQTETGGSNEAFLNPVIFYRIHVGVQSPEGVSTSHGVLRRFSDFLKLYSNLRKAFLRKDIPPAPPKHTLLRVNYSRMLLEERRHALEDWMGELLSDIDLSRSAQVAGFLELEAAARSSFQDVDHHSLETSALTEAIAAASSISARSSSSAYVPGTHYVASNVGNENAKLSDLGTRRHGKVQVSESSTEDLVMIHNQTSSAEEISNDPLGLSILDQPEDLLSSKLNQRKEGLVLGKQVFGSSSSKNTDFYGDSTEIKSEYHYDKLSGHARKSSVESTGSDVSSLRGSDISIAGAGNLVWDGSVDAIDGAEVLHAIDAVAGLERQHLEDAQIVLPLEQRHKLNRVLFTMQRRLVTAKTDMEFVISRLNQEMAVIEYLTTKVKDLEVELDATKQKSKDNLQQAILIERERATQMQWDMDELRRKYSQMESKLRIQQNEKTHAESEKTTSSDEKDLWLKELSSKQEELLSTQKRLEEVELKSKADIKVLVKEVKSLRNSQAELKKVLNQALNEKTELEGAINKENQTRAHSKMANKKLLHECRVLRGRLQECSVNLLTKEEGTFYIDHSSLSDALDLVETSDNRINLLLAEAQLLGRDDEQQNGLDMDNMWTNESSELLTSINGDNPISADDDLREVLADVLVDNASLRKQVNSVIRYALNAVSKPEGEDG